MQLAPTVSRNDPAVTRVLQGATLSHINTPEEPRESAIPQAPEKPADEKPRYLRPLPPWDVRIAAKWYGAAYACMSIVVRRRRPVQGQRYLGTTIYHLVLRTIAWPARTYVKAREFVRVVTSGRVDKTTKRLRDEACERCSDNNKRIVAPKGSEPYAVGYCGLCGCPESRISRLDRKNWYAGWECPRRKHPGPYRDEAYRHLIPLEQHRASSSSSGCSGCGGGK